MCAHPWFAFYRIRVAERTRGAAANRTRVPESADMRFYSLGIPYSPVANLFYSPVLTSVVSVLAYGPYRLLAT